MNIFLTGSETEKECKHAIYDLLMSGEWITHPMILAKCMGKPLDAYDKVKLSALDNRLEKNYKLKISQNIKCVFQTLSDIEPHCIEDNGKTKGTAYRYVGKAKDPLGEMRNEAAMKNFEDYWQFCQDSAGLLPVVWLEYFLKNTRDLFKIKKKRSKGETIIQSGTDRLQKNIELLPMIYESIIKQRVIKFEYQPYEEDMVEHILHPQFLHEFEGRWQVLGYEEGCQYDPVIYSLDRIKNGITILDNVEYIQREEGYFDKFFANTIGSTRSKEVPDTIRIRAHNKTMYGLTDTKKIHSSQRVVMPFGEYEDGHYGEFEVTICPNNEFYGRIMKMGEGLEIISPKHIRDEIAHRLKAASNLYT